MSTPWINLSEHQDEDGLPALVDFGWQAVFACQVGILPHQEWVKLKWGFNASALFDEAMERQRLFLSSQYAIHNGLGMDEPDRRSLALRFINRPGEGLLVAVLGKIHTRTRDEAEEQACAFINELESIFPYDYTLTPASHPDEFLYLSGADILDATNQHVALAQIKRGELPLRSSRNAAGIQGLWQSGVRSHEQIWRALGSSASPLVLNISLRSTVMYSKERERLLNCADEVAAMTADESLNAKTLSVLKSWNRSYVERRLDPWKKFFYLQVVLASNDSIDENILRVVGSTLTSNKDGHSLPDHQVVTPKFGEAQAWITKIRNLDVLFSGSSLPVPRLSEVADLEEVFDVIRIPYSPPENGFPNLDFAPIKIAEE